MISRAQRPVSRRVGESNTARTHTQHAHTNRCAAARRGRSRRKPRPIPPQAPRPSFVGPRRRVGAAAATASRGRRLRLSAAHRPPPVTCCSTLATLARSSGPRLEASCAKRVTGRLSRAGRISGLARFPKFSPPGSPLALRPPFLGLSAHSEGGLFNQGGKPSQKPLILEFTPREASPSLHPLLGSPD